jgi:hypothetical protein
MTPPARRRHRLELDALASQWQLALDAAQHALDAAHGSLPDSELASRAQALVAERQLTATLLTQLAEGVGTDPEPGWEPYSYAPADRVL